MFQGTFTPDALSILADIVKGWNTAEIYVGCSGNFTIERMLHGIGIAKIHGNDVTIYSCALGNYFSGNNLEISPADTVDKRYVFMQSRLSTQEEQIATILMISKYSDLMYKQTPYHAQMMSEIEKQWDRMVSETAQKIATMKFTLTSFYSGDVRDYIEGIPERAGFVTFPPFYGGGYEKMHSNIGKVLAWTPPEYQEIDEDSVWEFFEKITKRKQWAFGTAYPNDEYKDFYTGYCCTTNRNKPIYIYSSQGTRRIVTPSQKIEPLRVNHITKEIDIGDNIEIIKLSSGQFSLLRSEYLNANIAPATPQSMWGVVSDGYLLGCFAYSAGDRQVGGIEGPYMYLMSDFSVSTSKYERLSKLIVYAALSKEAKEACEIQYGTRMRSLLTTAFAKNPVSMKYRGIMDLISRKKTEDGKYQLNYGQKFGEWTLKEALSIWKQKHAKTKEEA